ncbi:MAG: DUF115 domain-containing protein [Spirochaetales bacterium]|nr:DUF115 domain-containing protein [Spirochaetales bacterium]
MNEDAAFNQLVDEIGEIGRQHHEASILMNAAHNAKIAEKSLKDMRVLPPEKRKSSIVISAGPSVKRRHSIRRIKESGFSGITIATDGSYVACLREGLVPDFVVSLDPHPTRIVRWFGDPDLEENSRGDDYFERQDLNIEFRNNTKRINDEVIELVNQNARQTQALVASTVHRTVSDRLVAAGFPIFWWNPLVDGLHPGSLTRRLYELLPFPCVNTGGTVGTAAWLLAHTWLKVENVAVVGMDFGYHSELPIENTQTYYELLKHNGGSEETMPKYFKQFDFPLTGQSFYTDPTYYWYRRNFLDLARTLGRITYNCTEGGTLVDETVHCLTLDDFLKKQALVSG